MKVHKVLFVDDEINIRNAVKRVFRHQSIEVLTAESGAKALTLLAQEPSIAAIITDKNMPEMDGIELVKIVQKQYPYIIRLMMSAYQDFNEVISVLNSGVIHQFITKPWSNDELADTIKSAIIKYETGILHNTTSDMSEFFDVDTSLPTQMNVLNHLNLITEQDRCSWGIFVIAINNYQDLQLEVGVEKVMELSKQFAKNLKSHFPNLFVGRFSESRYIILTPGVQNKDDCDQFAQTVLQTLKKQYTIKQFTLDIDVHVGVSLYPEHGASADYLVRNALIALDQTSHQKTDYGYYTPK